MAWRSSLLLPASRLNPITFTNSLKNRCSPNSGPWRIQARLAAKSMLTSTFSALGPGHGCIRGGGGHSRHWHCAHHTDLAPNLWENPGEVGGNGLDDDGNGYVDDVRGWDAIDNDANPSDTHGHGTFVATTAVAALNDKGMAGVAPDSTVMAVRVCDGNGCPLSAILTGLAYTMANGASVANLSFGGSFGLSSGFEDAVQANVDAGVVVVAAAGNHGLDNDVIPFYPASFDIDGFIAVAASDHDDIMASFSNYGANSVDLAAPVGCHRRIPSQRFAVGSGTSFAAPHVTGVAALVKAMRPDLDPPEIADLILQSVDRFPAFSGRMVAGGRLNAGSAIEQANAPVAVAVVFPRTGMLPFTVHLNGSQSFDPVGSIVSRSWKLPDGSVVKSTNTFLEPPCPRHLQGDTHCR